LGVHHVRLPVSDVAASREWYRTALGLEPLMVEEDEDAIIGIVLRSPSGITVGLHEDAARAHALRGFAPVAFSVPDVEEWARHLDALGIDRSPVQNCYLGKAVVVGDPDGIVIELHTVEQPSADEA
jgi:catechol 2,3-dioxygenase-like lactoylglutathione lyase family enzyme